MSTTTIIFGVAQSNHTLDGYSYDSFKECFSEEDLIKKSGFNSGFDISIYQGCWHSNFYLAELTPIHGNSFHVKVILPSEKELNDVWFGSNSLNKLFKTFLPKILSRISPSDLCLLCEKLYKSGKIAGRIDLKKRLNQLTSLEED